MLSDVDAVKTSDRASAQPSRRERNRAATRGEIVTAARELLVEGGTEAVTLRAIAGRLGLTAPALYRYFDSRELLLGELVDVLYDELAGELATARDQIAAGGSDTDLKARFMNTAHYFRTWALANRLEFGLLFGAPIPGVGGHGVSEPINLKTPDGDRGQRFGQVWLELFIELWRQNPVVVPADDQLDPTLAASLAGYHQQVGQALPIGALVLYLSCWMQLYGAVATEAFGHLAFALPDNADAEALFGEVMQTLGARLGLPH